MKEIANSRGEMTSQLSGEDQLKIQALPLNSYALMTTTFSFSSSKKLARNPTEKKRISKAERKRMKNGIIGNMSEGSTDLEATTSPTSFVLSLVVQKEKNDRDEETLRIHAPRELIQSYLDCLLFSN